MKCYKCDRLPEFSCRCKYLPFCSEHVGLHLIEKGDHKTERLDYILEECESSGIKTNATSRVQEIELKKSAVSSLAKKLIKEIKTCYNIALDELNSLSQRYIKLISFTKLSKTMKKEAQEIQVTKMKFKGIASNICSSFRDAFNKELLSLDDRLEEEKKRKILEIEEKNKIVIYIQASNSWNLEKKQEFMESQMIPDYQKFLSRNGECKFPIEEIKFSEDSKFCLVCKCY